MQRIRFTIFITLLSALSAPAFGKSTTQLDNGDFLTVIDATAGGAFSTEPHDFTYFSFEDQDVVVLTDAEAAESAEWHIAFKRSNILLNGGISGPGNVRGFDLMGADDIVAEDAFDAITSTDIPTADAFITDGPAYAISAWYSYNSSSHRIEVPGNAYELRTADGQFAKFVVDAIEGASRSDAGRITFRWVVADGTEPDGRSAHRHRGRERGRGGVLQSEFGRVGHTSRSKHFHGLGPPLLRLHHPPQRRHQRPRPRRRIPRLSDRSNLRRHRRGHGIRILRRQIRLGLQQRHR